jgi:RNA polymerase sigma-70 factor (ECF subfamily)
MKAWLARVVANTVVRGEQPRNRLARWARWFPKTPTVDASRFQGAGEPFPRHWRRFPDPWPTPDSDDPETRDALAAAVEDLPRPWREVLIARDALDREPVEIAEQQGRTPAQQRAILNRARARVRERLADHLARRGDE